MSSELPEKKNRTPRLGSILGGISCEFRSALKDSIENELLFRHAVESIADYAIFILDPQGYIQSWNLGAQRIKGYTAEEVIGKHFSIFYVPEDIQSGHVVYELQVASKEGRYEEEGWRVKRDGTLFWANIVISRLLDSERKIIGFVKVTRDLTQRRKAEERLRESEEKFRLLVSAVKEYAIFMLDPNGNVATWNDGAQWLKGYEPQEIIGQHFSRFYPEEDICAKKPEWELEEAILTGRFEDEGWRIRKDGTRFWANVIITATRNEKGKLIGFSKVTQDLTKRRRLEEKLRRSNEELDHKVKERTYQLEQAIQARDEFTGIISHELKTPITSLKLQVEMALRQLKRDELKFFNEKAAKFITGAGYQLDRLVRLIDDMLDISRISVDRLAMDMKAVELTELLQGIVERFEEQSKVAGSSISMTFEGPVQVKGDRIRLEQVFSNLLINALKYGGGKPISVSVRREGNNALISVQDLGIGIAAENQKRIFERFERVVTASSISGMGLGLFISLKIVEVHHGKIAVQSGIGKGSIFTVVLPVLS